MVLTPCFCHAPGFNVSQPRRTVGVNPLRATATAVPGSEHQAIHLRVEPWWLQVKQQRNTVLAAVKKASGPDATEEVISENSIRVQYKTGWKNVILHGTINGDPWKDYNLVKGEGERTDVWTLEIRVDERQDAETPLLEFVLTNGEGDWDKPPNGENYVVMERGVHVLRDGVLSLGPRRDFMVVTDLDDTLVGDDEATLAFKRYWEHGPALTRSALVFNTGRDIDKCYELFEEKEDCMPTADVVICSVGTKVYVRKGNAYVEDDSWTARLNADWDYRIVRDIMGELVAIVNNKEKLVFNPPDEQNDHKVTCTVHIELLNQVKDEVDAKLKQAKIRYKFISSGKDDHRYVDIVPIQAGKLAALKHVQKAKVFKDDAVVACGDSGNDRDMLGGETKAIVVGNAHADLREWAEEMKALQGARNGTAPRLLTVDKHRAWGILQGLELHGFK